MKTNLIQIGIAVLFILMYSACEKAEPLNQDKVVTLAIKGYVTSADTLDFINDKDSLVARGVGTNFEAMVNLFKAGDIIRIFNKTTNQNVGTFTIAAAPLSQVKRILYDGTTLTDNIELTPVTDPTKAGYRLSFSAPIDFGGKVDIQVYDSFNGDYTPAQLIQNVTGGFSSFFELPELAPDHTYTFKVFKPGTTDLPYTNPSEANIRNPATNYGTLQFTAGTSTLLNITPRKRGGIVSDGFGITDLTPIFQ